MSPSPRAYYNEHDPKAAAWLRALIAEGLIADGTVDERDIRTVQPADLVGYTQHHFFAGIGGWSLALRLGGWPDSAPVWTGSCPCQPFSAAGAGAGAADARHLWPAWFRLLRECRPDVVFGEQVANAIGHGWLDLVSADLEAEGYAVGAAVLGAAGVGAPHRRLRVWFVAESGGERCAGERLRLLAREPRDARAETGRGGEAHRLGDPLRAGLQERVGDRRVQREAVGTHEGEAAERGSDVGFWSPCDYLPCRDGKSRPVEPGTFPLAHGVPARVVQLRGYGNAIVPQVAAAFIQAYLDVAALD
jgi:DNA (cytosine-5)-methyltransferase 1